MVALPHLPGRIVMFDVTEKKMEPHSLVVNDIWIQILYVLYLKIWTTFRPFVAELYLYPQSPQSISLSLVFVFILISDF